MPMLVLMTALEGASVAPEVVRWQPADFAFHSTAAHENPFSVGFSATVMGPGGLTFSIPGFHDGEGTWKVRVSPTAEGAWSLVTHSDDPALDGKSAAFTCVAGDNPHVHGGLRVDPDHPRHFVYQDGTRYFAMGYECDWLWALDMGDPALPTINGFLDRLAAEGFNFIILNVYAHDCGWRKGRTGDDDYGPPPMYAWAGSNEHPDHSRLNLAFWQHYDRVIEALWRRGIVAHIMLKVYNKMVRWPAPRSREEELYFRTIGARYAAYCNVVWDFSKEAHNEKDLGYKVEWLRRLAELDPYGRLRTVHDDSAAYDEGAYDEVLDFRSDQQHSRWHETILSQRRMRGWPCVNVEFGYEHGPGGLEDKTYGVVQTPEEVCRRAWEVCLAGGYVAYYYTYTAWDVIRPEDNPPGYRYFRNLREFFERTRYWLLEPADELVSVGYCLADAGREYVVFLNEAGPVEVRLEGVQGELVAEWYQPFTGARASAGKVRAGVVRLTPPADWGAVPVALHVGA